MCDACGAALPAVTEALKRVCRYCGSAHLTERAREAAIVSQRRKLMLKVFLAVKAAALAGSVISVLGGIGSYVVGAVLAVFGLVGYLVLVLVFQYFLPYFQ